MINSWIFVTKAQNVYQVWIITNLYFWVIASYFDEIKIDDSQRWWAVWVCSRNIQELFRLWINQYKNCIRKIFLTLCPAKRYFLQNSTITNYSSNIWELTLIDNFANFWFLQNLIFSNATYLLKLWGYFSDVPNINKV